MLSNVIPTVLALMMLAGGYDHERRYNPDRDMAVRECIALFGGAIDTDQTLFNVSHGYALQLTFGTTGNLTVLTVRPTREFISDTQMQTPDPTADLTLAEAMALLSHLDRVKPKGRLTQELPFAFESGGIVRRGDLYERATVVFGVPSACFDHRGSHRGIRYLIVAFRDPSKN